MSKNQIIFITLGLSLVAFGIFLGAMAIRNGELYMIGTPVSRRTEPSQFWALVAVLVGIFSGLGIFFVSVGMH